MEVKIGKKKFRLVKVSIYISDLYSEYVRSRNDLITVEGDFEQIRLEAEIAREEADNKLDKLRAELKMIKESRALKKNAIEGAIGAGEKRNEILQEIVTLNGYDYIEDEWLKNFSEDDFSDLIEDLLGGKKKAGESSTLTASGPS